MSSQEQPRSGQEQPRSSPGIAKEQRCSSWLLMGCFWLRCFWAVLGCSWVGGRPGDPPGGLLGGLLRVSWGASWASWEASLNLLNLLKSTIIKDFRHLDFKNFKKFISLKN